MFQGVDLNSLGCQRYCSEFPPLPALSAQGSIRLLPGIHLPFEVFESQFGSTAWTIFAYLTVPATGYHAICAICILDLMFFDRDRWWIDPVPRFLIAAAGLEIIVVLQTVSMLVAAIADSVPAHADIYQVPPCRTLLFHLLASVNASDWLPFGVPCVDSVVVHEFHLANCIKSG